MRGKESEGRTSIRVNNPFSKKIREIDKIGGKIDIFRMKILSSSHDRILTSQVLTKKKQQKKTCILFFMNYDVHES